MIGLCHWLFADLDTDDADWFLHRLADGDGLAADSPIAVLRARIVKLRVGGGRVNETDALALAIYAWNSHRAGDPHQVPVPQGRAHDGELPGAEIENDSIRRRGSVLTAARSRGRCGSVK